MHYEKKVQNSEGQQFHQYQQNEQLTQIINHIKDHYTCC